VSSPGGKTALGVVNAARRSVRLPDNNIKKRKSDDNADGDSVNGRVRIATWTPCYSYRKILF
jgi:hypothetical protein